jgi:small-conductance mechanosensitive channel
MTALADLGWLGNPWIDWVWAAGLFAAVLGTLLLVRRLVAARLEARDTGTGTVHPLLLVARQVRGTRLFLLLALALYAAAVPLTLPATAGRVLGTLLVLALVLQGALWASSVAGSLLTAYFARRAESDAANASALGILRFLAYLAVWGVALLLALDNLGVDITALIAGIGIGGLAIGLAAQRILGDLFASLAIVLDKPFVIGDFIIVGDFLGVVEHVGLKTTRIRSLSGEQLVFSNSDLLSSRIRNYKRMEERRVVFHLGVTYDTGSEKLERIPGIIREVVERYDDARFDRSHFQKYGDFSLNFETVYYMLMPDYNAYMDRQQAINLEIYKRFEEEEIEFAYPTQTLFLEKTGGNGEG